LQSFMATHLGGSYRETQDNTLKTYLNRNRIYLDKKHFGSQFLN